MPIDFNQLKDFIEAIAKTDITELAIKEGDFELTLQKTNTTINVTTSSVTAPSAIAPVITETPKSVVVDNISAPPIETEKPIPTKKSDNWVEITSPMVGTFYRAPAPGESPFVELGERISHGQVVCIIEAMKLMNEIEAEISGQVMEILVENGEPVEYGQPLILISPN